MFGWICDKLIYMSVTKMFNLKVVFLLNSANTIWCVFSVCEKSEDFFVWNCFMSEIKYSHKWSSKMSLSRKWKSDLFRNKRKPGTKKTISTMALCTFTYTMIAVTIVIWNRLSKVWTCTHIRCIICSQTELYNKLFLLFIDHYWWFHVST